jgi:hypothetical protein
MLIYVSGTYERLYRGLASIKKCDMSENRHIVYRNNRTTVVHKNRRNKNAKRTKRSSNKTYERIT